MKLQINHITKRTYQGKNQAELLEAKKKNNFQSDEWLTFVQARENGLKIKKGSHGEHILSVFDDEKSENKSKAVKWVVVFNLDQTEGVEVKTQYIKSEEKIIPKLPVML